MRKSSKFFFVVLFALILAVGTYAYAAANVVPSTGAGDGEMAISGYTVTAVHYTLNAGNPAELASVIFTINPTTSASAPTVVAVQLVTGGAWFTCGMSGTTATCPVTGITALAASNLRVVAAQ
jgi:hypothetical protein